MPATVKEVSLGTRTARLKLPHQRKPFLRRIGADLCLGYYRPASKGLAGSWIARRYLGGGKYETVTLASADDRPEIPADGEKVLTFDQAEAAARLWLRQKLMPKPIEAVPAVTVGDAVLTYISERKARHRRAGRDAELRLTHHVLAAPLADAALGSLSESDLEQWRAGLRRGGRGGKANAAPLTAGTTARLLNDVRAALSAGARRAKAGPEVSRVITEGLKAPPQPGRARPAQILSDEDVHRLIDAATTIDPDFGLLVLVLAHTGGRLDQVGRAAVGDLQADRLMLPASLKGKGGKQISHVALPLGPDAIARLASVAAGRPTTAPLLMRWHHQQAAGDAGTGKLPSWVPTERRPWTHAAQMARAWRRALAAAALPANVVPYSLRHSSIVRGLRAGLPVQLVARMHDTSASMVERHYAAFIVSAEQELLRRALLPRAATADLNI